ncbi:MAG: hypothetical protein RR420_01410 [Anaerovoracaceae bacterium]
MSEHELMQMCADIGANTSVIVHTQQSLSAIYSGLLGYDFDNDSYEKNRYLVLDFYNNYTVEHGKVPHLDEIVVSFENDMDERVMSAALIEVMRDNEGTISELDTDSVDALVCDNSHSMWDMLSTNISYSKYGSIENFVFGVLMAEELEFVYTLENFNESHIAYANPKQTILLKGFGQIREEGTVIVRDFMMGNKVYTILN